MLFDVAIELFIGYLQMFCSKGCNYYKDVSMKLEVVFLLAALSTVVAERGFLLTGPKVLQKNSVETFCVTFQGIDSAADCTLDLINEDTVLAWTKQRIEGSKGCFSLSVPVVDQYSVNLRLQARFDGVDDYYVNSTKKVILKYAQLINLIQTDKPWYTPGQLVRIRVLILDQILRPVTSPIKRIYIQNPSGTIISQWENVQMSSGIHQMEMQLAVEPEQGLWMIKMEGSGGHFSKDFEVREYVLPKFEVILNPPESIAFNKHNTSGTQKIFFGICAQYSYGKPVRGTWTAAIKVEYRRGWHFGNPWLRYRWGSMGPFGSEDRPESIKIERNGTLDDDCYVMKLSGDDLGLTLDNKSRFTERRITVDVVVKEHGTDIESNKTWTTDVKRQSLALQFLSKESYQHGLPYYGQLEVKTTGGAPAAGVPVQFCTTSSLIKEDGGLDDNPWRDESSTPNPAEQNCVVLVSESDGIVDFQLFPTDTMIVSYSIKATVIDDDLSKTLELRAAYSPSNSFLSFVPPSREQKALACGSNASYKLFYTTDKNASFDLSYMVMSRGDIVTSGVKRIQPESSVHFTLSEKMLNKLPNKFEAVTNSPLVVYSAELDLKITAEYSPKASILAYYIRDDGEVVTASLDVAIDNCFPNPVNLTWSSQRRQPGQKVTLSLKSGPESICGYSVVDKSVTFIRPDLQLSTSNIYSRLPDFNVGRWEGIRQVMHDWEYCQSGVENDTLPDSIKVLKSSNVTYESYYLSQHSDAIDAFDSAGMLVMSNLKIQTRPCAKRYRPNAYSFPEYYAFPISARSETRLMGAPGPSFKFRASPNSLNKDYDNIDPSSTVSVRSYFPETWLWDLATLDSQGEMKKDLEMPHTITTWVGSALCVSKEQGFGMSDPLSIEAFQPFFLEVHLPYSVKRDEKLQIKVSVFNYLSYDIPIKLTLEKSKSFKPFVGSNSVKFCLPARNSVVQQFGMYALELGSRNVTVTAVIDDSFVGACGPETLPSGRDTVKKELIVKPEGFPIERVYSRMVCPKEFDDDRTFVVDLTLPHDLVEGSQRAWVTAVGDMMGPTLEGLSSLVRLPVGCGEQNMVLFTPNIFVMQYLESTNQLTKKIEEKTVGFMTKGYQRQLNYRHNDGSYSAFGPRDQSGSLWLTAFVVKSFAAARRYVHIDSNNLQKSVEWLQSKQLKNGCFPVVGTVLSSDMKGGAGGSDKDLAPLTAYTLVSLMEMYSSNSKMVPKKLLANTLPCLRVDDSENRDLYTTALSSYALALAGEMVQARQLVDWLFSKATRGSDGRTLWWEKPGSGKALNVELTSYALLSLVKLKAPRDVLEAGSIVRWLSKQRNSWGGFVSTQDTVVALQAMGEYASLVGLQLVDIKMNVFAETFARNFSIREKDRLVQRRVDLPLPLASDVTINSSTGRSGCATVQTTLRYNVHTAPESDAFDLTLTTAPLNQGAGACGAHNLTICTKYLLSESSNMALIEIAMISGYQVDKSSLDSLISNKSSVKRYEVKDDNVVLYFDEIQSRSQVCFDIFVQLAFQVADAKDSNIKIYDYYHTEHAKSLSYKLPSGPC